MRKIAIDELEPGQRFNRPVYIDDDSLFVPEGLEIKERDIERLRKWRIEFVMTDGDLISDDPQSAFNAFFLRAFNSPEQKNITRVYDALRGDLMELFGLIRANEDIGQDSVNYIVDRLLAMLDSGVNDVVQYMLYGMQGETGDVENALNTAALSALVGRNMQLPRHRIVVLVTAALLHDVGMLRLNPDVVNKKGALNEEERRQIATHPIHSYRVITKELGFAEDIGLAALQHQERWDGHGYPRKITKEAIRLEARIIAVADSFVAMVSNKPYRTSMIGYTAMRNLLSDNGTRFDPDVLKTFIQVLGIYPIGSIVLLNDSSVCRVLENRSHAPLKPRVKVIIDAYGREYIEDDGPEIDLGDEKTLFIAKAVDANSLTKKNFSGAT
jgi:hypothetical protein